MFDLTDWSFAIILGTIIPHMTKKRM